MVEEMKIPESSKRIRKAEFPRRQIALQTAMALIIFISGVVVGSGATLAFLKNKVLWMDRRPRRDAAAISREIGSKYGLTDEQVRKVEEIFVTRLKARQEDRKEFGRRMEAGRQQLIAEMKEVLSPDQFDRWLKDFEAMHARRGRRRGPPRPPKESGGS
jgi:hypothetical protein